jgi:hypothetical protein
LVSRSPFLPGQDIREADVTNASALFERQFAAEYGFDDGFTPHALHLPDLLDGQPPRQRGIAWRHSRLR